jgi:hypothetical protein
MTKTSKENNKNLTLKFHFDVILLKNSEFFTVIKRRSFRGILSHKINLKRH